MNNVLFVITVSLVFLGIINNVAYLINIRKFFKLIQEKSPQQYQVLTTSVGASITSMNPSTLKTLWSYLSKADYKSLNDQKLNILGNRVRILLLSGILIFVLFFILFVTNILVNH